MCYGLFWYDECSQCKAVKCYFYPYPYLNPVLGDKAIEKCPKYTSYDDSVKDVPKDPVEETSFNQMFSLVANIIKKYCKRGEKQ